MMHSVLPTVRSRLRLLAERCIFILLALLGMRTWYVEGLIIPCRVNSGSMAAALLGLHRDVTCGDCGHRFVCGADLKPVSPRAVCPNCGYTGNDLTQQPDLDGDRLLMDKSALRLRPPRRWEVVAFRRPGRARQIHIKRVVALPGESIQIRHGDVYADGVLRRKTLRQQRAVAVLVHDATLRPTLDPALSPRWQGESRQSQWGSHGGRFAHPRTFDKGPIDWLVYRHWCRVPGGKQESGKVEVREGPVTDDCGYNQTRPRREEDTHPVTDLMLSLRLVEKTLAPGVLVVRATDGREEFRLEIYPHQDRYRVLRSDWPDPVAAGRLPDRTAEPTLEMSLFDQQLLVAFDGQVEVNLQYDRRRRPLKPTSRPLAIGARGLLVEIRDLRVYRDVYYTRPLCPRGRWGFDEPVRLADDEYFVLGDNSPISEDSRTWPEGPAVSADLLVGKPLLVHFPARRIEWGKWRFQVPDPSKIRYIR